MSDTFDREAINRVRAFLNHNERQERFLDFEVAAEFLRFHDALVDAVEDAGHATSNLASENYEIEEAGVRLWARWWRGECDALLSTLKEEGE